jgi:uncharacterized protein (TIGR03067 family)
MMPRLWVLIVAGLGLGTDGDATQKELARLAGVWRFAEVTVNGKRQPDVPFETHRMIILKDGKYVVVQGERVTHGIVTVDPSRSPRQIDVTITTGRAKGQKFQAIYELDGDTYRFCGSFRSNERPTALGSEPGSGQLFEVFVRDKQDPRAALQKAAHRELAGRWQALNYALDGKAASAEELKKVQLSFDETGKSTATSAGKTFIAARCDIDPTQEPMTIDMSYTEGELKGQKALGIFRVDDDVLTICRGRPAQPRPRDFTSKDGSGYTLMTYRRDKSARQ